MDKFSVTIPAVLSEGDISRIIEMAWEDRTPFEAIELQFGYNESQVVALMRRSMKPSSFRMWRKRMAGRVTPTYRVLTAPRSTSGFKLAPPPGQQENAPAPAQWCAPRQGRSGA
jgi:uncharacterized protein (TIGR03643 family)